MSKLTPTPGQTVGPFYGYALPYNKDRELLAPGSPGSIRLQGTVYDGAGHPIPDAILEIWQADAEGKVPHHTGSLVRDGYTFTGFGRSAVGNTGAFTFTTVNPGPTEAGAAPFISVAVFARGLMNRLFTRVYLPENEEALAADRLLSSLTPERRRTLIARRDADGGLSWDIRLQGEGETVFLDFEGGPAVEGTAAEGAAQ
ncbi:protocatechuate 3,4-dioxygenase subunit alpha [Arthrobacter sp. PAMC25564]|uniref:protocatechuate 3,4-dioxygenase subunit alpha n=1 Tax=Arthrobacter sp. PAMC25564 TaxID=2565366 RepID=UPI0010A237A2|nr:protocatechuate 3,4-dioxygenase subunit alpha [Arthrobacter sp. PAMC25564]QCB96111.1 protocatechuate 3,4-dioxygenase subunit alpha [Arthrobacter sp. PAMC25564]